MTIDLSPPGYLYDEVRFTGKEVIMDISTSHCYCTAHLYSLELEV